MKRIFIGILILLIFLTVSVQLAAQEGAVDSLFFRAVKAYENGEYAKSLEMLEMLDQIYKNHTRTTGSLLMQGKSFYKLGRYKSSLEKFSSLIDRYGSSQYVDDALYGLASAYYKQDLYKETVVQLMKLVDSGGDERLLRNAAKLSSAIMDYRMDLSDLQMLLKEVYGEKGKAAVTLRLAQREIEHKHYQGAKKVLQDFINIFPGSAYLLQIEQLMTKADEMGRGLLTVGVLLPLTGPMAEQGNRILDGIQYAVDIHNQNEGAHIQLAVRDSESNIVTTIKKMQDLCETNDIIAVIGELQSEITAAVAAVAVGHEMPVLAPTASMAGISGIGPSIFQINGDVDGRGRLLAKYAVEGLGQKNFALLAPADGYGQSMKTAFASTVQSLGGEIFSENWYFEGAKDLGPQFKTMRKAAIEKMIEDSMIVIIKDKIEFEEKYKEQPWQENVLYVEQSLEQLVDSTSLAVTIYDGVFLPVYREDLDFVISQYTYYNIQARIFGGSYWNDEDVLGEQSEDHKNIIDGAIFLSDFYVNPSDFKYYRFRDAFRKALGKTPERMEIFGYDTMNLLLQIISQGYVTRNRIRDGLAAVQHFEGIGKNISFNENRSNITLPLLQYRGERIIQIK